MKSIEEIDEAIGFLNEIEKERSKCDCDACKFVLGNARMEIDTLNWAKGEAGSSFGGFIDKCKGSEQKSTESEQTVNE